ncbi:biotin--[acetyl-CoA-carboxylase] ligase [bacterium]|nr:biotin--[acetyl-CoA-carboxylase] ligase [bacterium]
MLKDDVLYVLEKDKGNIVTGGNLAKEFAVSRTAIWKAIKVLKEEGNEIISVPNSGYVLMGASDNLLSRSIGENLKTEFIGRDILILKTVHSTNQYVKGLDIYNAREGLTVIADEQTQGKGRRGREFLSPSREGIYMSILLKPEMLLKDTQFLTICTAVAVSKAIESIYDIYVDIKWVNDIYYKGKKLCGILTEAAVSAESQSMEYAVVGIGINTGEVPYEIRDIATSLEEAGASKISRNKLIAEVLNCFEDVYAYYSDEMKKKEILEEYRKRLFVNGRKVLIAGQGEDLKALVIGIKDDGALIVKDENGEIRYIISGEIKKVEEES